MQGRRRLTYANVASTVALFLALTGGVVYAATKIQSRDLAKHAVKSSKIAPGAVRSGDVSKHAITSAKLAAGAVKGKQLATAVVGSAQIKNSSVGASDMRFPVYSVVTPSGGSAPVTSGPDPYPVSHGTWSQSPGQIDVVFGGATATIAFDGSGSGSCQVFFEILINGQQVGGNQISTDSTTPVEIDQSIGAQPEIDPPAPAQQKLRVMVGSNGDCTSGSTIDSTRFRVLDFG